MIVTLTGKNHYLLQRKLQGLTAEFVKKYGDLELQILEADEIEEQAIMEAVQNLPFLSKRKMVVIRDLGLNKAATDNIEQIISSISDSADLIIYDSNIDRRSSYFKVLKTKTQFEEFTELDGRQLANWLVKEAKTLGGELSFSDANFFVERLGTNQSLLANELDKLITYDSKISRQNIDLLSEANPQSRVFELLDAAFSQNKSRALKLYEEQRAQKVEPQAILAMIGWQLRLLAIAKHMGQRSSTEVSKEAGVPDYPLRKARDVARKIDDDKLKDLVSKALDIDIRSKTTAIDLDEALKTYIITL